MVQKPALSLINYYVLVPVLTAVYVQFNSETQLLGFLQARYSVTLATVSKALKKN